jgi:serine/threonine protein kinase
MRSVGRYELLSEIGRGGMGIVYLARQPDLDRLVALKELHSIHADSPEFAERFIRESRLAGSLNHPNIVTVYEYFEADRTPYIAMEHVPRGSLRSRVGDLSLPQLAGVLEGLLAGLAAVAPSGIVHRDLKPENIMVTADGRVKIADFGIAKATQGTGASFMTATGTTVGTPAYMAPEQALSQPVGPWTDLYSVGVMTYEQLVGQIPFHDTQAPMAILMRHINEPIPPVTQSRPDVDPLLSDWIARLLLKEPAQRTPSAVQAWEELEEIVLELLGPRWRRDARLSERDSAAIRPSPLTPAPFESQAPARPEVESGFLSYGRAPTGAGQPPPVPLEPSPAHPPPIAAHRASLEQSSPSTRDGRAPTASRRPPRPRMRLFGAVGLMAVLAGTAGFVFAPTGESARTPPRENLKGSVQQHGPSRAYAAVLSATMSKLNSVRAVAGEQLAHARTASAQAAAAQTLAHAHEQAAAAIRSAAPGSPAQSVNVVIATALADVGSGYSTMASAARREDRRGFDSARTAVTRATASLAGAFAQLHELGYRLGS